MVQKSKPIGLPIIFKGEERFFIKTETIFKDLSTIQSKRDQVSIVGLTPLDMKASSEKI